ncbi:MAG: hypothetical protein UX25_C0037G0001 [Candidatus Woesebacteria bacterium GW2011_GWC2_45_9]|uniref:DUF7718 domain-containing protein n=2 Tax=Microgenomates group TaxID=1794810 RepID=A0A0G1N6Y0_9BACT|nr:MAG: hypothetical protein UW61_C0005G0001 [Candidatus Curtissbacteria bacterium GW2011_GWC1_44_33]KKU16266.1 MAG: hypothetical protein UX25_C0037G0001 [Candidatus Woesebacteria bacterium GW2011_GWC2_45_9]
MGNKSKFRHSKGKNLEKRLLIPVKPNRKIKEEKNETVTRRFYLSDSDRIIYSYEIDQKGVIQKVVDVSYDININGKWITIMRYDSKHGFLHRHMRVSLDNPSDTPTTIGVRKRGKPHSWLTWARKDVSKNFLNYRTGFFKRSKIRDLY